MTSPGSTPPPGGDPGEVALGHLTGPDGLGDRVDAALAGGAARVVATHDADDDALAWAAARAGLRREGVLRGVLVGGRRRDVALVARLAGDPDPASDALPALTPLFPASVLAAGLVLRDHRGRVLLLRTSYKVPWEVPGGFVEAAESLGGAAAREGREELGLDLTVGRLLVLDRCPGDASRPGRLLALLDGGVHDDDLPGRCTFVDGEVLEAAWCTPTEVRARTGPGLAARVAAAVAVLDADDPAPALLVEGRPGR